MVILETHSRQVAPPSCPPSASLREGLVGARRQIEELSMRMDRLERTATNEDAGHAVTPTLPPPPSALPAATPAPIFTPPHHLPSYGGHPIPHAAVPVREIASPPPSRAPSSSTGVVAMSPPATTTTTTTTTTAAAAPSESEVINALTALMLKGCGGAGMPGSSASLSAPPSSSSSASGGSGVGRGPTHTPPPPVGVAVAGAARPAGSLFPMASRGKPLYTPTPGPVPSGGRVVDPSEPPSIARGVRRPAAVLTPPVPGAAAGSPVLVPAAECVIRVTPLPSMGLPMRRGGLGTSATRSATSVDGPPGLARMMAAKPLSAPKRPPKKSQLRSRRKLFALAVDIPA